MWFDLNNIPVILASASPRRKELLDSVGIQFDVIPSQVDEKSLAASLLTEPSFSPEHYVKTLALAKGKDVAIHNRNTLVISADTVVVLDNNILEKPVDKANACRMLGELQNRQHTVWTAIAVFYQQQELVSALNTQVTMRKLTSEQIEAYVNTGEPMDKAGAYAIQGLGSVLIERIDGCYTNVVGLSLPLLYNLVSNLKFG